MTPSDMGTPKKPWPHECEYARMDSIANAIRARNCLKLAMQHITDATALKNMFEAIECCHEIEISLIEVKNVRDGNST